MTEVPKNILATLPPEILDQIVGLHANPDNWRFTPALLALHLTSRDLRECSLRFMCRHVTVRCGNRHKPNTKLHAALHPNAVNSRLGGIAPYIRSLRITVDVCGHSWYGIVTRSYAVDLEVLATIHAQSPLRRLKLDGGQYCVDWRRVHPDFGAAFRTLFGKKDLDRLLIYSDYLTPDVLDGVGAQELELENCELSPDCLGYPLIATEKKAVKTLLISNSNLPDSGFLSNAISLSADILKSVDRKPLTLNLFPCIERFSIYRQHSLFTQAKLTASIYLPLVDFFLIREPALALTSINLRIDSHFRDHPYSHQLLSSEDIEAFAKDDLWTRIDEILTSGQYPSLKKFGLGLRMSITYAAASDIASPTSPVAVAFSRCFPRLRKSSVEVHVSRNYTAFY